MKIQMAIPSALSVALAWLCWRSFKRLLAARLAHIALLATEVQTVKQLRETFQQQGPLAMNQDEQILRQRLVLGKLSTVQPLYSQEESGAERLLCRVQVSRPFFSNEYLFRQPFLSDLSRAGPTEGTWAFSQSAFLADHHSEDVQLPMAGLEKSRLFSEAFDFQRHT